ILYERHRRRVFVVCLGVLGSPDEAQDALQEVFAAAATQLRSTSVRELRPWLVAVARNVAIDVARARRPRREPLREPAPGGERPAVAAARRGELAVRVAALRRGPERQGSALVMRELGGSSYAEIAGLLGIDEVAVRGLIARARLSLRAGLEAAALSCEAVRAHLAS